MNTESIDMIQEQIDAELEALQQLHYMAEQLGDAQHGIDDAFEKYDWTEQPELSEEVVHNYTSKVLTLSLSNDDMNIMSQGREDVLHFGIERAEVFKKIGTLALTDDLNTSFSVTEKQLLRMYMTGLDVGIKDRREFEAIDLKAMYPVGFEFAHGVVTDVSDDKVTITSSNGNNSYFWKSELLYTLGYLVEA